MVSILNNLFSDVEEITINGRTVVKQNPERKCGDCQLCCYLMPIKEIGKPASKKCEHQKFKKGCKIHETKPLSCSMWNCAWLTKTLPDHFPRPDRAGYVVDPIPDYITYIPDNAPDKPVNVPVLQVWVDTRLIRNGSLRLPEYWGNYLNEMADKGYGFLFRENSRDAITAIRIEGEWIWGRGNMRPSKDQLKDMFTAYIR